jgi:hypothetical protein
MLRNLLFAFCLFAQCLNAQSTGNPANLPFTLSLEEVTQDELPGLHSFAFARYGEWWVIIGGRINGLHGFFINTGFPEDKANAQIFLINPETGASHQFFVEQLNLPYKDQLRATNPQYVQDGNRLYICGGYGKDVAQGKFVTFPVLSIIDLPTLVAKMEADQNPVAAFTQRVDYRLQVCGGEMEKMGDWYYLVGGHDFSGLYNQNGQPQFTQTYTNEIRRFQIADNAVVSYFAYKDENKLHRRDFTLGPVIQPNGAPAICLYGGVFRVGVDLPFYNPVYISEDNICQMDAGYEQLFSQYTCPVLPLFDSTDGSMYSIFFGGLSVHTWDPGTQTLQYDEKVPFIKDITTFQRRADGSSREYVMPQRFDELLGTNMIFVPAHDAPQYPNEVLRLHAFEGPVFAGWLYGGIKAEIPNFTPSSANKRLFKVFITPKNTSAAAQPDAAQYARILPNVIGKSDRPYLQHVAQGTDIRIFNALGKTCFEGPYLPDQFAQMCQGLPAGAYFLHLPSLTLRFICL